MDRRVGPYLYKEGWKAQKRFSADGTSTRTFTVVVSSAYDAGIIGTEYNGIAILDEDKTSVLLDQHLIASSGYSVPTRQQKAEYHRILGMNWAEFSEFCRTNKRFRKGVAPDIEARREPDYVEDDGLRHAIRTGMASETGTDIRTPEMKELDDKVDAGGLKFPCRTREQMLVFLGNHEMKPPDHHGAAIAWNIKARGFPVNGKGEIATDDRFDKRWEEYLQQHCDEVFWQACEDELSQFLDGSYDTYPGEDEGSYEFGTRGRQNGWLYLRAWDGPQPKRGHNPMHFDHYSEYVEYLLALSPADLCRLYKLVANVDHDVRDPDAAIAHHFNSRRSMLEQEWAAELENEPENGHSPTP
ncbi:hypothetical protein ACVIGB_000703 [Bradyrhizobium sp. USDA 4341]